MADSAPSSRIEPSIGPTSVSAVAGQELRAAVEPAPAPDGSGLRANLDQLSRIEDKTARIEEKYARTESSMQRVGDKVEAAMGRMTEAARHADLVVVRERVDELARRVRRLPGLNALVFTAIVTALLAAAFVLAAQKYLLAHLP